MRHRAQPSFSRFQGRSQGVEEFLEFDRFGEIPEESRLEPLFDVAGHGIGAWGDDRYVRGGRVGAQDLQRYASAVFASTWAGRIASWLQGREGQIPGTLGLPVLDQFFGLHPELHEPSRRPAFLVPQSIGDDRDIEILNGSVGRQDRILHE